MRGVNISARISIPREETRIPLLHHCQAAIACVCTIFLWVACNIKIQAKVITGLTRTATTQLHFKCSCQVKQLTTITRRGTDTDSLSDSHVVSRTVQFLTCNSLE